MTIDAKDVTRDRLAEITTGTNWSGDNVTAWTRKSYEAPFTATERRVSALLPMDLGFVTRPLLNAPSVRRLSKLERKALYSLLSRGICNVYRYHNPDREEIR